VPLIATNFLLPITTFRARAEAAARLRRTLACVWVPVLSVPLIACISASAFRTSYCQDPHATDIYSPVEGGRRRRRVDLATRYSGSVLRKLQGPHLEIHTAATLMRGGQDLYLKPSKTQKSSTMPFFAKVFKTRESSAKKQAKLNGNGHVAPPKPQWSDAWLRSEVSPEEVQELLHGCTNEAKARGEQSLSDSSVWSTLERL
jgi:hypothetical protein